MKKIVAMLAVLCFLFAAGCAKEDLPQEPAEQETVEQEVVEEPAEQTPVEEEFFLGPEFIPGLGEDFVIEMDWA